MRNLLFSVMVACKSPPTTEGPGSCPAQDDVGVELSQGEHWGMSDGDLIQFGIPPQGGAPYAPFQVRLIGMPFADLYEVDLKAVDRDSGETIGTEHYSQRFVCANVGENKGTRYTPELHMRFYGWAPEEIAHHDVDVRVEVMPEDGGAEGVAAFRGTLDWVLGPMPD